MFSPNTDGPTFIGPQSAIPAPKDHTVMAWARENAHVVFTHDLDFGTLLALTRASGPSVIQARTHDVLPDHLEEVVVTTIRAYESKLRQGAIVTIDESGAGSRTTNKLRHFMSRKSSMSE
jgi:predicted nuclease of predicted toxin-antitoxin system